MAVRETTVLSSEERDGTTTSDVRGLLVRPSENHLTVVLDRASWPTRETDGKSAPVIECRIYLSLDDGATWSPRPMMFRSHGGPYVNSDGVLVTETWVRVGPLPHPGSKSRRVRVELDCLARLATDVRLRLEP